MWKFPVLIPAVFGFLLAFAAPLHAVTLIRDADIEHALKVIARPLIDAAGLSPDRVRVLVVKDTTMNAFVVDAGHVFINSGLLLRLDNAAELQAVLAHELAHISGGHLTRRAANMQAARGAASLGFLLAFISAVSGGSAEVAGGIVAGVAGSATGVLLAHTRAEEASADHAAVRYMARSEIDPRAMEGVLELFRGQETLSVQRQDPYVRSHPLTADRMRALKAAAAGVKMFPSDPEAAYWFDRTRAKLGAFLSAPSSTLRKVKKGDKSDLAELARAVAYHRQPDPDRALRHMNRALAARPNDAYYYDLKGQILLESRDFGGAVRAYEKSNALRPNHPQILAGLGRALLAESSTRSNRRALAILIEARARDQSDARLLRDLAQAYARAGQNAMASLATAERYALLGRPDDAILHAGRAAGALPEGSTAWRRARDVIHAAKLAKSKRKQG